jgi:hypothetical protein
MPGDNKPQFKKKKKKKDPLHHSAARSAGLDGKDTNGGVRSEFRH